MKAKDLFADKGRWDPTLVAWFEEHRKRWERGEIRLSDYISAWKEVQDDAGHLRKVPMWYPEPLDSKCIFDKGELYDRIDYKPAHPSCKLHASTAHFKSLAGGSRYGKSFAAAMEVLPLVLSPGTQGWIVGPEYINTIKEFGYIIEASIEHPKLGPILKPYIEKFHNRPDAGAMELVFNWGPGYPRSFMKCKSAQQARSAALLSEELDWMLVCEAPLIDEFTFEERLRMRMVNRDGMMVFPASPAGMGWTNRLFNKGLTGDDPDYFSIRADTRANPTIDLHSIARWTEEMDDHAWDEQVLGKARPKHGLIYPGFDADIHVRSFRLDWPKKGWKRYCSFDFGFQDPFVCLWAAKDEDGRFYIYREFYRKQQLHDDVVSYIAKAEGFEFKRDARTGRIRLAGPHGQKEKITQRVADWDAQGRAELLSRGVRTRRAKKEILPGIETVSHYFKVQRDGRPRLFIHRSCKNLIRELMAYEWGKQGGDAPKDKQDDHALDSLRYLLHTLGGIKKRNLGVRVGA